MVTQRIMSTTPWFITICVLLAIFLLVTCIVTAIAAIYLWNSPLFTRNSEVPSAYHWNTDVAIIAGVTFAMLIIILFVAGYAGGFEGQFNTSGNIASAYDQYSKLQSGMVTQLIVLIILAVLLIMTFATAILSIIAAVQLSSVAAQDSTVHTSYYLSITASIFSVLSVIFFLIAISLYTKIRTTRANNLKLAQEFTGAAHTSGVYIPEEHVLPLQANTLVIT